MQATDNDYAAVARSWDEYESITEAAIFEYAFRLGARLTIKVQTDTNESSPRSEMERGLSLYNLNTVRYGSNAVFISFWV